MKQEIFLTCSGYGALNLLNYIINVDNYRRFKVCMGEEEQYLYNLDNFFDQRLAAPVNNLPLSSPFR